MCHDLSRAQAVRFNRLMQDLRRAAAACILSAGRDGPLLRAAMNRGGIILGLLADQSSRGLLAPFLGRDCYTGLAPAVLALRYHAELFTGFCYRVALAKWRLELGKKISTHENNRPRPSGEIMGDQSRL